MDALIKSPELSNLNIITSGAFPTNPSELINSRYMSKFIEEIRGEYDFVIFDSPPVLPVTDAVLLSQKVDGVIILYEVGKIARGVLRRSKSHLDGVKANILGVILNGVRPEYGPDYYEYQYQYYYEEGKKPHKPSDWEKIKETFKKENLLHLFATSKEKIRTIFAAAIERLSRFFKKSKT
jgi:Mrp family chromosome partitioning ATPase